MAVVGEEGHEEIIAVGRYTVDPDINMAEVAFLVRADVTVESTPEEGGLCLLTYKF